MGKKTISNNSTPVITYDDLWNIFYWGVDYGQLLMEEERESEEISDAMVCAHASRKYCIPSVPLRRRQVHSEKWFEAKRGSFRQWKEFMKSYVNAQNKQ